ncbi:MAG: SRPBCC domain-containing protein [Chloroflexota bacterium]
MRFDGNVTIGATRDRVWAFLIDPREAGSCVPGIGGIDVVDGTHFAITKVGVGTVRANVKVTVERADSRPPEHVAFVGKGRARGVSAEARAEIDLSDGQVAGTTVVVWSIDVAVAGLLAHLANRVLDRSARSIITQTLRCMNSRLTDGSSPTVTAATSPREDVIRFDPNWCMFWASRVSSSQLDIWIPYLRRSGNRFAIMTPDDIRPADREKIARLANTIVVEPYVQGIEWLRACRGFRGYLYVGTQSDNFLTVNRHPRQAHVWIGHGESGKGASGFRTGSLYDSIFVADYSVVRRFPRSIRPWVWRGAIAIGTAVVEGVRRDAWSSDHRKVRTVLYAPTWEGSPGDDYTSLDVVAPVLRGLVPELSARHIEVLVRPHPATGKRLPELTLFVEELRTAGLVASISKAEAFERADVLISDVSGVTAEFLMTEKPSIMPIVPKLTKLRPDSAWLDTEYPWVYRWDATADGLLALLGIIETGDPLRSRRARDARRKFRHHRSIDDAVRSFDAALSTLWWRSIPLPLRFPYEIKLLVSRLRSRFVQSCIAVAVGV